jgi:microcystin-dependent protein
LPLETATYISDLVVTNPANSDGLNQADDHMRLIKAAVKATFPAVISPATRGPLTGSLHGFLADAGSAAAPAYSFSGGLTMGFYAINFSTSVIGVSGTLRGNGLVNPGAIMDFGFASPPTGWFACDGSAVSRTAYADLFAAIGITWGAGDGSTTFNLPNLINRYRRHRDGGTLAGAVGNLQGPTNLTHTHGVVGSTGTQDTDHTHTFSGNTGAMSANASHTHGVSAGVKGGVTNSGLQGGGTFVGPTNGGGATGDITINSTNTDHTHAFSGTTSGMSGSHAHAISITSIASGDANESRPYSATVLTCIKY